VLSALESATQRPELKLRPTPAPAGKPASAPAAAVQPSRPQASAQNFWVSDAEARKLFGAFVPQSGERGPNVKRDQVKISSPGMQSAATPTAPERKSELPPVWEPPVRPSPQSLSEREPASPAVETEPSSAVPVTAAPTLENACPAAADAVPENAGVPEESRVPRMEPLVMLDEDVPLSDSETADTQTREIPDYVIVGEVYNCYVIVQLEDRILLIDKHAAHERIIFDQLCENMRSREKNAQLLMFPIHVDLTEAEVHALKEYREKIESIGFSFQAEAHGILLTEIPTEITRDSAPDMIMTLASRLADGTGSVESTEAEFFEARLYQASCKAAIKGGRLYSTENIRWLCDRLLRTPRDNETAIKTCPHGRPVAFEIRKNSIERQFSRLL